MKETIIGKKTACMILVSFLVSLKSPDCPDSLAAVTLISEKVIISIGMTKTQAFHTPISKAGMNVMVASSDVCFPLFPLLPPFYAGSRSKTRRNEAGLIVVTKVSFVQADSVIATKVWLDP